MTVLAALQAMLEYENDDLLAKALLDRGVTSTSATYTAADQRSVELAAADIYLALCSHPNFREGSKYVDYAKGALMSLRYELLRKWAERPNTVMSPGVAVGTTNAQRQIW